MVTIPYQMRITTTLLFTAIFLMATITFSKAQEYGKLEYWGKSYNIDRNFFEYLNTNMDYFLKVTGPQLKSYDYHDYSEIYVKIVDFLKKPDNTIIVTEANQLQFRSVVDIMPGQVNEVNRSKKSKSRAVTVLLDVVLPSLQSFKEHYNPYPGKFNQ